MKIASFLPFAGLFTAFSHALPSLVEREASPRVIGPEGSSDVPACWKTLSCSFADIQASSMTSRSSYVSYMQSTQFIPLKATNKFNAVIAVIDFFVEKGLGAPGTWVSYVDAGIVEAIQLGGAYALGMSKDPGTNLGATKWTAYFNSLKANKLQSRDDHDYAWSMAEQTATMHGKDIAEDRKNGIPPPSPLQKRWYQYTQIFRFIMRNRGLVINSLRVFFAVINPELSLAVEPFIDWLTDVTNYKAAHIGLEISWAVSELDQFGLVNLLQDAPLIKALFPQLWAEYLKSR